MNKVLYGQDALDGIFRGAEQVVKAVGSTIGSRGRNGIIGDFGGSSRVTNDGVTLARSIYLPDPVENIGAHFVKTAAASTEEEAGDGTTTTTLLLGALLEGGKRALKAGVHPMEIKRALETISEDIIREIKSCAIEIGEDIESLVNIATISANNDAELGRVIGESYFRIGKDARINVKRSSKIKNVEFEELRGMTIDRGVELRSFMPPDNTHRATLEGAYVLITDHNLRYGSHTQLLENVIKTLHSETGGDYRLVILADDMDEQLEIALSKLRFNGHDITYLKAPGYADTRADACYDLAVYLGGTFFTPAQKDLKDFTIEDLGYANTVVAEFGKGAMTTFIEGRGDEAEIQARLESIESLKETEDDEFYVQEMEQRISNLRGRAGVIHVGGTSEVEVDEKIFRIDDTLRAVECAMEDGYVVGGGMTLYNAKRFREGKYSGLNRQVVNFALDSLENPLRMIVYNTGVDFSDIFPDTKRPIKTWVNRIRGKYKHVMGLKGYGYNSNTGEIEDLLSSGIIDPAKVTIASVRNAFATAVLVLTSQTVVKPTEVIS